MQLIEQKLTNILAYDEFISFFITFLI